MKSSQSILTSTPLALLRDTLSKITTKVTGVKDPDALTVPVVDLPRFMGPWYVQGHTPLVIDNDSSDQVETYSLTPEGKIATTYEFRRFGRKFVMHPEGEVINTRTNARWNMRFFKVLPSTYLIVRLKDDYSLTVISVPSKKLVWIMTRTKTISENLYREVLEELKRDGYAVETMRRVPQSFQS